VHLAWLPNRKSPCPARFRQLLHAGFLAALFSQLAPLPAQAAVGNSVRSQAASGVLQALAKEPQISSQPASSQPSTRLQLLDYPATQDRDDDLLSDFRRWADILVGDYETFLPLIAMFVCIGVAALTFDIRRRRPPNKARSPTGLSLEASHQRAARDTTLTRMAMPRNLTSMPRNADRSRSEAGPLPPSR
jgi:hypothetical protein